MERIEMRPDLAVVDDKGLYTKDHWWARDWHDLASLLASAAEKAVSSIWVCKGCKSVSIPCQKDVQIEGWHTRSLPFRNRLVYFSAIRHGGRLDDKISIGWTDLWPWEGVEDPKVLLVTLGCLEQALGEPIEWTPAHMALQVLKRHNSARWDWWVPMKTDLESMGNFRYGQLGMELMGHGPAPRGKRLVKVDGNSAYGAGMTSLNIGEGEPEWVPDQAGAYEVYDKKKPGIWKVEVYPVSRWQDWGLPSFQAWEWMSTDLIEQVEAAGVCLTLQGGWVWSKYHQALRSTVSNKEGSGLWDQRLVWRGKRSNSVAAENCYASISTVLHTLHGKLADKAMANKRLYRPDVWALVVAASVARMVYRIARIYQLTDLLPSMIHIDALWYSCDDEMEFLKTIEAGPDKLGGMKHVYGLDVTDDMRENWKQYSYTTLNRIAKANT